MSLGSPFLEFFFGLPSYSWPKVKNILHPACSVSQRKFLQSNTAACGEIGPHILAALVMGFFFAEGVSDHILVDFIGFRVTGEIKT